MNIKIILQSFLVLLLTLLYQILFVDTLGSQLWYVNSGFIDLSADIVKPESTINGFCIINNTLHYYNTDILERVQHISVDEKSMIVANQTGYVQYTKYGNEMKFYSNRSDLLRTISTSCYPHMFDNQPVVYLIKSNGSGFSSEHLSGGTFLNEFSSNSLITSINVDKNLQTALSFLDGNCLVLNGEGQTIFSTFCTQSRINITKTAKISSDGTLLGVVQGIDPQYLKVFKIEDGTIMLKKELDFDMRYSPLLFLNKDKVYVENGENLEVLSHNIKKRKKPLSLQTQGELNEFVVGPKGQVLLSSRDKFFYYLLVYNERGIKTYYMEFPSLVQNLTWVDEVSFSFVYDNKVILMKEVLER